MSVSHTSTAAPSAPSSQASSGASAAAQASLNRLLAKYQTEISKDPDATDLGSLGRQITAAAKALGQHVSLPKASGKPSDPTDSTTAAPTTSAPANGSKEVDIKA